MCTSVPKQHNFYQVTEAIGKILGSSQNETLSQTQFNVLDELMREVNRLIEVHCSETADMVRFLFFSQYLYVFANIRSI